MRSFCLSSLFYFLFIFCQQIHGQKDIEIVPFKDPISNKYGYINKNDSSIFTIKPLFDQASSFHEGYAVVCIGGLHGLIDTAGHYILKPVYKNLSPFYHGILFTKDSLCSVINIYGRHIINFDYNGLYRGKKAVFPLLFQWENEILDKLSDTTITDGILMAQVLKMYINPDIRFNEMIQLAFVSDDLAIMILKFLNEILSKQYGEKKLQYFESPAYKGKQ